MPLFDAKCIDCETTFEYYVPRFTEVTPFCKKCGGLTERQVSAPAFHDFNQTMGATQHTPFVTTNITGERQEFRTHKQLQDACKRAGVHHVPDKHSRIG